MKNETMDIKKLIKLGIDYYPDNMVAYSIKFLSQARPNTSTDKHI
ncbi:hypothetical protein [Butyrivibrio hungatei]|uniref:Uncharacterized protein n=1 Tax=Butyrivibrio hungatei TaxID=185008 RepID=A0A1D9P739_9FIRM|nr:hypothetical protein [Butyrivibrio hungatei]AOZ97935.1 hypothetical protein bhn_II136 [Butyrivibrio hungatei]